MSFFLDMNVRFHTYLGSTPSTVISVGVIFITDNNKAQNQEAQSGGKSIISWLVGSVFILFAFSLIRYLLPLVGSFTILLVIPAILMLCVTESIGCWATFLAIPLLITSAIVERYFLVFPNSLLIACFVGLDLALFLNVLSSAHQVKNLVDYIFLRFGISTTNYPPFPCRNCGTSMEYIESSEIDSYLSYPQQVARSLDSMQYLAWYCPQYLQFIYVVTFTAKDTIIRVIGLRIVLLVMNQQWCVTKLWQRNLFLLGWELRLNIKSSMYKKNVLVVT